MKTLIVNALVDMNNGNANPCIMARVIGNYMRFFRQVGGSAGHITRWIRLRPDQKVLMLPSAEWRVFVEEEYSHSIYGNESTWDIGRN